MCKACNYQCCDTDHLAECGCAECFEPNCWPGWEASQERDPGDGQPAVDYGCSNCGKVLTDSHHAWAPPEVLATLLCGDCWLEVFEQDREGKVDHNW